MVYAARALLCVFVAATGVCGRRTQVPRANQETLTSAQLGATEGALSKNEERGVGDDGIDARAREALRDPYEDLVANGPKAAVEEVGDDQGGFFQATAMILSPEMLLLFSLAVAAGSYFGLFEFRSKADILLDDTQESNDEKISRLQAELASQRSRAKVAETDPEGFYGEAFAAEVDRSRLMQQNIDSALSQKFGSAGVAVSMQAQEIKSPGQSGGLSWAEAYQTAKSRSEELEGKLIKLGEAGTIPAPSPQPGAGILPQTGSTEKQAEKLRDLFDLAADAECLSELLSEAVPAPKANAEPSQRTDSLPAFASFRDAVVGDGCNDFLILGESFVFDRCYALKGSVPAGTNVEEALQSMAQRVNEISNLGKVELFLQPTTEAGTSLLVAVLESDLPPKHFEAWQWIAFGALLLVTMFSANNLSFLVIDSNNLNLDTYTVLAETMPAAIVVLAVVLAQETTRRMVASSYNVKLSLPFVLPAFPLSPIGTLGALTQRMSASPNKAAEFDMSAGAGIAGYIVSFGAIIAGIAVGLAPTNTVYTVSLNYQLLPLVLRAMVRPFLDAPSVVDVDTMDPFAFPANPLVIGGLVGAFLNSLLLLPVGCQDGGILARLAVGNSSGNLRLFAYTLALLGFLGGGEEGQTYVIFFITLLVFNSGLPEIPPKDDVTEISGARKAGAIVLLTMGVLLSLPGWPFPNI